VLWYPVQRGSEVLHAWAELTRGPVPDELTTVGRFVSFPPIPPIPQIPEPIRGQSFVIVEAYHLGDPAQADQLLGPLRALGPASDTIATAPVPALSHLHMDPEQPVPGAGDGMLTGPLPADAIDALVRAAGPDAAFPLTTVELRHLGGELARPRPENGALACLNADYLLFAGGRTGGHARVVQVDDPVGEHFGVDAEVAHACLEQERAHRFGIAPMPICRHAPSRQLGRIPPTRPVQDGAGKAVAGTLHDGHAL
jgi:hypothetical protein